MEEALITIKLICAVDDGEIMERSKPQLGDEIRTTSLILES